MPDYVELIKKKRQALLDAIGHTVQSLNNNDDPLYQHAVKIQQHFVTDEQKFPAHSIDNPNGISFAEKPEYIFDYKRRKITKLGRYIRRNYKIEICDHYLNMFCASVMASLSYNEKDFRTLESNDIIIAYDLGLGGSSCMTGDCCIYTQIYAENPDKVKLLVYNNKSRALLWTADCGTRLLDRIYPNDGYHVEQYKVYAHKNNIVMRRHQGAPHYEEFDETYYITLKKSIDDVYPYMDSFMYAKDNGKTITITNKKSGNMLLESTYGRYTRIYKCTDCGEITSHVHFLNNNEPYCHHCAWGCAVCGTVTCREDFGVIGTYDSICKRCYENYGICNNCGYIYNRNTPHVCA